MNTIFGEKLWYFCVLNIHPNAITLLALIFSISVIFFHVSGLYWFVVLAIILRTFFDCLDGPVARKCKKTSKLGGYFDIFADTVYIYALTFVILSVLLPRQPYLYIGLYSILILQVYALVYFSMFHHSSLHDHTQLKEYEGNIFKRTAVFIVNNNIVCNLVIALAYIAYYKFIVKSKYL